jgi:hypothetical protein
VGCRVLPISWGAGVPLWLSNTPATVVGLGRSRVRVRFDSVQYAAADKPHSVPPEYLRVVG